MMNKVLYIFLLAGVLLSTGVPAFAQTSSASDVRQLLEQRDREIKAVLGEKNSLTDAQREQLRNVINAGINFEAMARTALGSHWSDITPAQRSEFVEVFGSIVRNQSLSNLDVYRSKVSYENVSVDGQTARAVTRTVYKDVPTDVVYVLGQTDGEWKVSDIILDDVSTAEGYARSFQTVIRKRGFGSLMESLRKKLDGMST